MGSDLIYKSREYFLNKIRHCKSTKADSICGSIMCGTLRMSCGVYSTLFLFHLAICTLYFRTRMSSYKNGTSQCQFEWAHENYGPVSHIDCKNVQDTWPDLYTHTAFANSRCVDHFCELEWPSEYHIFICLDIVHLTPCTVSLRLSHKTNSFCIYRTSQLPSLAMNIQMTYKLLFEYQSIGLFRIYQIELNAKAHIPAAHVILYTMCIWLNNFWKMYQVIIGAHVRIMISNSGIEGMWRDGELSNRLDVWKNEWMKHTIVFVADIVITTTNNQKKLRLADYYRNDFLFLASWCPWFSYDDSIDPANIVHISMRCVFLNWRAISPNICFFLWKHKFHWRKCNSETEN